jgi:hypothetical protein
VKKKSVYKPKLARAIRSALREVVNLKAMTAFEAGNHLLIIFFQILIIRS